LQKTVQRLETCKSAAIDLFRENADKILEIVGPKAANFASQEAEQQDIIRAANHRIQAAITERSKVVAEVEKYINLLHTVEVSIGGKEAAIAATKEREAELQKLIVQTETTINNIPTHTTENKTTTNYHPSWWGWRRYWWGWRGYTTTTTTQVKVANPDRNAQVQYYSGIINAREARRKEALAQADTEATQMAALQKTKAEYQAALKLAQNQLCDAQSGEGLNKITEQIVKEEQDRIATAAERILNIREQCDSTENLIGMKGSVLLECLSSIRNFVAAKQSALKLWQPLISVLEHVITNVDSSLLLLEKDPTSVYVAGIRLMKNVSLFHTCVGQLRDQTASENHKKLLAKVRTQYQLTN
jgi:hypothetical protein